jgi:hypothetical protein
MGKTRLNQTKIPGFLDGFEAAAPDIERIHALACEAIQDQHNHDPQQTTLEFVYCQTGRRFD